MGGGEYRLQADGFLQFAARLREIAALPSTTVAVTRGLMRGHLHAVMRQIEVESSHFRDLLQSDEACAAFLAVLARKK